MLRVPLHREVYPALKAAGVELHVITAEPGDVQGRLANRKVKDRPGWGLGFP